MKINNNKRGGFTCFLSIVITSVIVLMTVLMNASSIRSQEALLVGIMSGQQDLLLSKYSEKLLDWYGIYAAQLQNSEESLFCNSVKDIKEIKSYKCTGIFPLENDNRLKEAILNFSKARVPMQMLLQFFSRFTEMNSIISSQNANAENIIADNTPNDPYDSNQNLNSDINYEKILELLSFIDRNVFDKCMKSDDTGDDNGDGPDVYGNMFSWDRFNSLIKNDNADRLYEMDISKQIKSSLTLTESSLNDISSFLDQFYQIKMNPFYEKLCFEFYTSSMFSCKTNTRIQNDSEIKRKDMRGRFIDNLPTGSKLEIEKIIFGYEKDETNDFFARISIESMRFLCHLITNMTDNSKKAEIKSISAGLCAAVLIASGGTIAIPPSAMDIVILLMLSMNSAVLDYKNLAEGNPVSLLPVKGEKNIDTFYMDYMQLLLLMVPEQLKINRMLVIIKENLLLDNIDLYTGVKVSAKYRNSIYEVEGQYYGYSKTIN